MWYEACPKSHWEGRGILPPIFISSSSLKTTTPPLNRLGRAGCVSSLFLPVDFLLLSCCLVFPQVSIVTTSHYTVNNIILALVSNASEPEIVIVASFPEDNPFGHVVNGEKNTITLAVENKSGRNVTLTTVAGSFHDPETNNVIKNVRFPNPFSPPGYWKISYSIAVRRPPLITVFSY